MVDEAPADAASAADAALERRLLALLPGPLWRTDADHRLVSIASPALHGTDPLPADAAGRELWTLFDSASGVALRERLVARQGCDELEVAMPTAPGRPLHRWRLRARPCSDANGRFAGHEGTLFALPEPLRIEAPASGQAESFSVMVSHDLRAPIRVVEGFTRILKEDYGRLLDRIGNDHLDRVLSAAARMNSMIDALLALSQLSTRPLAQQRVNLSQLAGYIADDLRRQSPERRVRMTIEPDLLVQGDPTLLRVVLENLLGNAWKYSGKRRDAQIWFGRHPQQPQTFTVRDNGAGFDMRFADRLFGVFQRLHSANDFHGTGVGLASVQRIVRRHGGEVWAESEVDRGASFHFSIGTVPELPLPATAAQDRTTA